MLRDEQKRDSSAADAAAYSLLRAPRGQRAVVLGCPELVQTTNGFAINDDLGKARKSSHLSKLSLQLWVLCQVDLFEDYAALREERLRADAESARVSREEDHATRHVDKYKSPLPSLRLQKPDSSGRAIRPSRRAQTTVLRLVLPSCCRTDGPGAKQLAECADTLQLRVTLLSPAGGVTTQARDTYAWGLGTGGSAGGFSQQRSGAGPVAAQ
jgi:hypothetical protein